MSAQPPLPPNNSQQDYQRAAREAMNQAKVAAQDALNVFLKLIYNPVGELSNAYASLPGQKAIAVGAVFAIVFALLAGIAGGSLLNLGGMGFKGFILLLLSSAGLVAGLVLGSWLCRMLFKSQGAISFDIFLAGAVVLPLGLGGLASWILAQLSIGGTIGSIPIMVGGCLSVLVLFTGLNRVAGIREGLASYLVAGVFAVGMTAAYLVGRLLVKILF